MIGRIHDRENLINFVNKTWRWRQKYFRNIFHVSKDFGRQVMQADRSLPVNEIHGEVELHLFFTVEVIG